jgi:hypothetical protein
MTISLSASTWIESMSYKRTPDGATYLAFFLKSRERANGVTGEPTALLYGGPASPLPSWLPGLVAAGRAGEGASIKPSPGKVYHRLVKERYQGQMVKGEREVRELKEMMK